MTARSQELTRLLAEGRLASDPELKHALSGLANEVKGRIATGSLDSHDFFVSVADAIQGIRGTAHIRLRADCLRTCCQYFYLVGTPLHALRPARALLRLAQSSNSADDLRKANTALGILCSDTGNFGEAIECYARALQIARDEHDVEAEVGTWLNLATTLTYMSRHQEALECLEHVFAFAPTNDFGTWIRRGAAHDASICYFNLGDPRKARYWSEKSIDPVEPASSNDVLSCINREQHYIEALLELGEYSLARERLGRALRLATLANTTRATCAAELARSLVEAYCGNVQKAVQSLEALLTSIQKTGVSPDKQDVFRALAKAYERAGQMEKALDCLQQMLETNRRHREAAALIHLDMACESSASDYRSKLDLAELHQRHADLRAKVAERELLRSRIEVLERLAVTADLREEDSGAHGYRVGRLCALFAEATGWRRDACEALEQAARLHDIGKVGIPDRVLLSTEVLKESERKLMLAHTSIGAELLARSNIEQLQLAEEIARCHHEWWDGSGYPSGLVNHRIPISARIVALADVFDSLTHGRTYEAPWSSDAALAEIQRLSGQQFDPSLAERFLVFVSDLLSVHDDLDEFLGGGATGSPVLRARSRIRSMLDGAESRVGFQKFDLATSKS